MDDSQPRSRRSGPRPFYDPRPGTERTTPSTPGAVPRVTPSRAAPRLFTPPGSLPMVPTRAGTTLPSEAGSSPPRAEISASRARELDELKEIEPWAMPAGAARQPNPAESVAEALERVARRLRAGEVVLPPDSDARSDEAALALALAALLRAASE